MRMSCCCYFLFPLFFSFSARFCFLVASTVMQTRHHLVMPPSRYTDSTMHSHASWHVSPFSLASLHQHTRKAIFFRKSFIQTSQTVFHPRASMLWLIEDWPTFFFSFSRETFRFHLISAFLFWWSKLFNYYATLQWNRRRATPLLTQIAHTCM